MEDELLIVVCGARRTGTTLVAAILSVDQSAPPLPGEAQLLPRWLESYRWARESFSIRALPFFPDDTSFRDFYRRFVGVFVSHCREHFRGCSAFVLKSPEVSLFLPEAHELLPAARFVVTTRDPRDQVASEWHVLEKRRSKSDLRILESRSFDVLSMRYLGYYRPILQVLERDPERILLQSFEELVQSPRKAIERLARFTGLDLRGYDPGKKWPRVADSYWAYGTSPSDTPFYGKAIEPDRVGSYRTVMSENEARYVQEVCSEVTGRLGYETHS